jgi:hypothetical protein
MGSIVLALILAVGGVVIVWRGIALFNYGFHKKQL